MEQLDLRLYAIVDPENTGGHDLIDLARAVAAGGATLVQLRDKVSSTPDMIEHACALKAALATWREQPGMLGLRLTFHRPDTAPQLADGTADWLWTAAERHRIPIMVHAPDHLQKLGEIAARHPGLTLIVDHMGFGRETMDAKAPAGAERVAALARYDNVFVKVSALPCFSSEPYPFRNLNGTLRRVIEAFGPRRSFWGTDLSRMLEHCSYRQGVTHFTQGLDFLSADDLDWIMGRGLRECLRWDAGPAQR